MRVVIALFAAGTLLQGCGPTCQSTCQRLYAPNECNVPIPGVPDWTDSYKDCVDMCKPALGIPGELGDYDPDEQRSGSATVSIDNERQAAAWMDCVAETDCERINEGYCEPH